MSLTATRPGFVLRGWHVLAMLVAFFAGDIVINTVFMVIAYSTFPGETSVTPYEDGLIYDKTLAQERDQAALGWRLTAGVADGRFQVQAFDHTGAPLGGLRMTGVLSRPATEAGKHAVTFAESAPGLYVAPSGALSGAWDISLTAIDTAGRKAVAERRLVQP